MALPVFYKGESMEITQGSRKTEILISMFGIQTLAHAMQKNKKIGIQKLIHTEL